ncbi:MAG: tRNA (guanosine(46)-N7)-methyltransferase TrmB [Bacteroidales bacterium]|nr:tRNA (guanosine(46)-N7)-methyltransferase TrmB [Bacteroidales bacterium]
MKSFQNVIQPSFREVFHKDFFLKGRWNTDFFTEDLPITVELGCGRGEYSVEMARLFRERNFLGIDIKGARIWKGAKIALHNGIANVGFIRTRIDFIDSFFSRDEVSEIWITFPDPQLKKNRKRLTSARFLNMYKSFLKADGLVHLKTDNPEFYNYTLTIAEYNKLQIEFSTDNLYTLPEPEKVLMIKTYYERMWLEQELSIHYLCFKLNGDHAIEEVPAI